jgi:thymidylate synthase
MRVPDLQAGYVDVVKKVWKIGEKCEPRGFPTREVTDAQIIVDNPHVTLPTGVGRDINLGFAACEALQVTGGYSDPSQLTRLVPRVSYFMDGGIFHGAYGPRLRGQLPYVIKRLQEDRDTRRAVLTIWDPARDLYEEGLRDYPCTMLLAFMIRKDKLRLSVTMRSNDVWWGLGYDAFVFSTLQATVARMLDIEMDVYVHNAISLHAYERDGNAIEQLHIPTSPGIHHNGLRDTKTAMLIGSYGRDATHLPLDESERWFLIHAHPLEKETER